jgi:2-keto-myo-inositol isomerase
MPRFGLNGATTGSLNVETDIRVAGEVGYQAIELRDDKIERYLAAGHSLTSLAERVRDAGVEVLSINALEDATLAATEHSDARLGRWRQLCEWAAALDARYAIAVPSLLSDNPPAEDEVRVRSIEALRSLSAGAREFDVRVGFEFLGFPGCSVNTLRAARRIVEAVDDPSVGLVIDAFHFYVGGSRLEDFDGLDPSRLFIVHVDDAEPGEASGLSDAQRLLPGDGVVPLDALVRALERLRFGGVYSLELFRPEYWAWDPSDLARQGLERMQRLFP